MPFTDSNDVTWTEGENGARTLSATVNGHDIVISYDDQGTNWQATFDGGDPQPLAARDLQSACEAADAIANGM